MRHKAKSIEGHLSNTPDQTLNAIHRLTKIANQANAKMKKINIPYFDHLKVIYFHQGKMICITHMPEMVGKMREIEDQIITVLRQDIFFKSLYEIKTKYQPEKIEENHQPIENTSEQKDNVAQIFERNINLVHNPKLKEKISDIIRKHKNV